MPTVLLVRHGQASFGADDYDVLSPIGLRQAEVLADELARRGVVPTRVRSGDLRRQRGTAEVLARAAGIAVEIDPGLNEYVTDDILAHHATTDVRLDAGHGDHAPRVTSRDFQALLDVALQAWIAAGADGPAAEPWPAFAGRVRAALDRLLAALGPGETAIACTSGGAIGSLCAALMELPPAAMVGFNRVTVNTGIARVVSGRRGVTLVSFNEQGHLDGLAPELRTYR